MNKLIFAITIALTLSGCVTGPPNYNERDRKAYNSLQEVDKDNHVRNYDHDRDEYDDGHDDDYNPRDGHDHWARQSN